MPSSNQKSLPLLSIKDIASLTGFEESLLRYYESEYASLLPAKALRGDHLYFTADAVDAFRRIHAEEQQRRSPAATPTPRYGRVVAITSGKGGVGKSSFALNFAIELQRQGQLAILLDADMGMANIHLMAGIRPKATIMSLVSGDGISPDELITDGPEGIGIIAGGSGMATLADAPPPLRQKIIAMLAEIERRADIIIVDTSAGMGRQVRDFLLAADDIIFILTPEITSLADGYGLLKALTQENKTLGSLYAVINMAENLRQAAGAASRFSGCGRKFLKATIQNIGYILKDATVSAAIARGTPLSVFRPDARASRNIRQVATAFLHRDAPTRHIHSSFKRYLALLENDSPLTNTVDQSGTIRS